MAGLGHSMHALWVDQKELSFGPGSGKPQPIVPGAWWIPDFVGSRGEKVADLVLDEVQGVCERSPFRQMKTPRGQTIQAQMTACGEWGWVSDASGYHYRATDPLVQGPWPEMPLLLLELAQAAAARVRFHGFAPDTCLVNRYQPGTTMGLHRDADEVDFSQPIVSFSFGLDAAFRFGGPRRKDPIKTVRLGHGDVVVWGGPARCNYHGISRVYSGVHDRLGEARVNLTFRRAK